MRTIVLPLLCLILGLGVGYLLNQNSVTPTMIEEGIRKNPRLVLDLLQQNPEEIFDIVIKGQELKRNKAIQEQREEELRVPIVVKYDKDRPVRGNPDAEITIVEFSDFQCPHCAKANAVVEEVLEKYKDKVKLVFMHMPLSSHKLAMVAAKYYEAALLQDPDKAWKLHDLMFAGRDAFAQGGEIWLQNAAKTLGLDVERLKQDAGSEAVSNRVLAHDKEADRIGLRGTPSFVIGGVLLPGYTPLEEFSKVVDMVLEHKEMAKNAPAKPEPQEAKTPETPEAPKPAETKEGDAANKPQ